MLFAELEGKSIEFHGFDLLSLVKYPQCCLLSIGSRLFELRLYLPPCFLHIVWSCLELPAHSIPESYIGPLATYD